MSEVNNLSKEQDATPRTDKAAEHTAGDYYVEGYVDEDVCRDIERDLNEAVRHLRYHMQVSVVVDDDAASAFLERLEKQSQL